MLNAGEGGQKPATFLLSTRDSRRDTANGKYNIAIEVGTRREYIALNFLSSPLI
jgi:hypothetical protein